MGDKSTPAHKSKVMSKSSPKFTNPGPSGKMQSKMSTGTQKPGQSAQEGRGGGKFAKGGGSGGMAKKTGVKEATPA